MYWITYITKRHNNGMAALKIKKNSRQRLNTYSFTVDCPEMCGPHSNRSKAHASILVARDMFQWRVRVYKTLRIHKRQRAYRAAVSPWNSLRFPKYLQNFQALTKANTQSCVIAFASPSPPLPIKRCTVLPNRPPSAFAILTFGHSFGYGMAVTPRNWCWQSNNKCILFRS